MLGGVLATWLASGLLASVLLVFGFLIVIVFFMWMDWQFAVFVVWVTVAIILVIQWLSQ